MKKLAVLFFAVIVLVSCGKEKKEGKTKVVTPVKTEIKKAEGTVKTAVTDNIQVVKGKRIFTSKGCVVCHQLNKKVIGPSLQDIAKIYADKKGNMVDFLKGKANAIVDTDPAQVAIMKANIKGVLKDMSTDDIHALVSYIHSTGK